MSHKHTGLGEDAAEFKVAEGDGRMIETRTIDLAGLHLTVGTIALLKAEMPVERSPFALVHYAVDGEPQRWNHRLDLDKRTFLDDFESGSPEEIAAAADSLTDFLLQAARQHERSDPHGMC